MTGLAGRDGDAMVARPDVVRPMRRRRVLRSPAGTFGGCQVRAMMQVRED